MNPTDCAATVQTVRTQPSSSHAKKREDTRTQPIPGYADYTEAQNHSFSDWKQKVAKVYEQHGFTLFNSRPLEKWENLSKDGTLQQVFRVVRDDGSETDLALPFDRTVSLALYIANYAKSISFPFKRADIAISHRGEKAAPGRFRGFIQADVDIVSRELRIEDDVECLVTLIDGLKVLKVPEFVMYLNQIELPKAMIRSIGISEDKIAAALRLIDKLDKMTAEEVLKELLDLDPKLEPEKTAQLIHQFKYQGPIEKFVIQEEWGESAVKAVHELREVYGLLPQYGVDPSQVQFSPGMVRGLAYYTGLVFETFLVKNPNLGSIASGGRYVNLVGDFNPTLQDIGGVGGSIGLTRLFDIMVREKLVIPTRASVADICVAFESIEERGAAISLSTELRKKGHNVDLYSKPKIKNFLGYTDKKKIPFAVIVKKDSVAVKEMLKDINSTNKQHDFGSPQEAVNFLDEILVKIK